MLVVGLGCSIFFYVINLHQELIHPLVEFPQQSHFAGLIFSKSNIPGTFALSQARLDNGTNAPDVVLSMRWTAQTNEFGIPGMLTVEGSKKGTGSHGSLSPYDLHNTLVGCGPDLRCGFVNEMPSGNIDLAPTILWLLGVKPIAPMDGRVLLEAMADQPAPTLTPETKVLEATANLKHTQWRQHLRISLVDGRVYFDEGNGK